MFYFNFFIYILFLFLNSSWYMCKVLKSNEVDVDVDAFSTQGK